MSEGSVNKNPKKGTTKKKKSEILIGILALVRKRKQKFKWLHSVKKAKTKMHLKSICLQLNNAMQLADTLGKKCRKKAKIKNSKLAKPESLLKQIHTQAVAQ